MSNLLFGNSKLIRKFGTVVLNLCYLISFSARAMATSDNTAELQAKINDAIAHHRPIVLEARYYRISSTVTFTSPTSRSLVGLTVTGAGIGNTVIDWEGPPTKSVFALQGAKLGSLSGFSFTGKPALADLDFAGHGSSSNVTVERLYFENPTRFSVRLGTPHDFSEVSEFSFRETISYGATAAGFQIEGNNSLNENFYNCGCSHEPVCVSNSPELDPGAQPGGNFNWFGGSISATPEFQSDSSHATFLPVNGATYNFIGVRVENSSTLFYVSSSNTKVMINWIGGMFNDWYKQNRDKYITVLGGGGSFHSAGSIWMAGGSFYFGVNGISNSFDGDVFRLGTPSQSLNKIPDAYFDRVPKGAHLRLHDTRSEIF